MSVTGFQHQLGVTLIELLVTMVIISVGVLGVAGLQIVSLQQAQEAGQRMVALQAANDLFDRIRVNKAQSYARLRSASITVESSIDCANESCSTAELRTYDLNYWACRLGQPNSACKAAFGLSDADFDQLPLVAGEVTRVVSSESYTLGASSAGTSSIETVNYEISVHWATDSNQTACSDRSPPTCQKISVKGKVL